MMNNLNSLIVELEAEILPAAVGANVGGFICAFWPGVIIGLVLP